MIAGKKVLVLGATGRTGQQLVSLAVRRGHDVTALVRRPEGLAASGLLRVVAGSVEDSPALARAIAGQDAVISTLGVGSSLRSSGLIARSAQAIVGAMARAGVRRLVFTSAYGVGATWRDVPFLPRIVMSLLFRDLYADKAAGEEVIRGSSLDWTLVYPVTLTNGPRTGRYRVGERLALCGFPRVSRADVADFLLTQVGDRSFVRKCVLIGDGDPPAFAEAGRAVAERGETPLR
jgi:putative NADH-flavin reductase